jgi:hypothetical protein
MQKQYKTHCIQKENKKTTRTRTLRESDIYLQKQNDEQKNPFLIS